MQVRRVFFSSTTSSSDGHSVEMAEVLIRPFNRGSKADCEAILVGDRVRAGPIPGTFPAASVEACNQAVLEVRSRIARDDEMLHVRHLDVIAAMFLRASPEDATGLRVVHPVFQCADNVFWEARSEAEVDMISRSIDLPLQERGHVLVFRNERFEDLGALIFYRDEVIWSGLPRHRSGTFEQWHPGAIGMLEEAERRRREEEVRVHSEGAARVPVFH